MKKILIILLLSTSFLALAQNEGTLRLYLTPAAEAVTIDGELMEYGNSVKLKPGKYFVQAWCPNKAVLDTIIEIKAGETQSFFYRFENSATYKAHLAVAETYSKKKLLHVGLPATTTVLVGAALVFTYIKGKQVHDETEDKYQQYKYAGYDLSFRKSEFEKSQKKYRGYYYAQFAEYTALAVSSYFLYKGIKWLKKNPRPELEKDKNPFTLDKVGFLPNQYGGYGLGLVIKLN